MTITNPHTIKTEGEQTSFSIVDIPDTELIYHDTIAMNSVSRKPHHGENVVSQSYLPPKLIVLKNNFPALNSTLWTFGTTLYWEDLKSWISNRFVTQYSVTDVEITDIEIDKACFATYTDNQKKYHCYIVVCGNDDLPNMYVSMETEHDNNLLVDNAKMMQTYRLAENVFLPIGLVGQNAGWYMTLDSNGNVRPSTVQFQIPSVTSVQVTNDYITNEIETITVDKFRNKSLLETGTFVHGMDTDEVFTRRNELPSTIDRVFYCPRNSVYRYRAKGTSEEIHIINEIPTAQVLVKTLTLKKTMKANEIVPTGYNVLEKPSENYAIEYVDKTEIHVWYSGEIIKVQLDALPIQLLNGNRLRYYFEQTQAGDEYVFDVINNGNVTSSTRLTLPATQDEVTVTIAVVFGCTLMRNIADIMSVETHNNRHQEFEIKEELGYISYIYKKPVEPIVIYLGINYFDYRGLLALDEFSSQETTTFLSNSGFIIDPRKRFAYRVDTSSEVITLGDIVLTKGKQFIGVPSDIDVVSFTISGDSITLTKHNSEESQTFEEGTVSIHVDFFPFEYKNVLYEIRRSLVDSEGYSTTNLTAPFSDGTITFPEEIAENIALVVESENVKIKIEVRADGKLVLVGCTLDDDENTGFLKLKIGDLLVKYVITRELNNG